MNIIRATGALRKFLDARSRGASREVLTQLSLAAMAEQKAKPTSRRSEQQFFRNLSTTQSEKNREQRSRDVVIYLERVRLEREWQSVQD